VRSVPPWAPLTPSIRRHRPRGWDQAGSISAPSKSAAVAGRPRKAPQPRLRASQTDFAWQPSRGSARLPRRDPAGVDART